jgi:hypothetical protein
MKTIAIKQLICFELSKTHELISFNFAALKLMIRIVTAEECDATEVE